MSGTKDKECDKREARTSGIKPEEDVNMIIISNIKTVTSGSLVTTEWRKYIK
jgi:hypothetical protein